MSRKTTASAKFTRSGYITKINSRTKSPNIKRISNKEKLKGWW